MIRSRTSCLLLTTALAACVLAESPMHHPLTSGPWRFAYERVLENSCFPLGVPVPAGYPITSEVSVSGAAVVVDPDFPSLSPAIGSMTGMYRDGELTATGARRFVVSTACTLAVVNDLEGAVLEPRLAIVALTVRFDGQTMTSAGLPSQCQTLAAQTVNDLPFPALSNPTSGSCSVTVSGWAAPLP